MYKPKTIKWWEKERELLGVLVQKNEESLRENIELNKNIIDALSIISDGSDEYLGTFSRNEYKEAVDSLLAANRVMEDELIDIERRFTKSGSTPASILYALKKGYFNRDILANTKIIDANMRELEAVLDIVLGLYFNKKEPQDETE